MIENKIKKSKKKKLLLGVGIVLTVMLMLVTTIFVIWKDEISTLSSIKMIRNRNDSHQDGAVYTMHVKGGFYLDDFVEQGGVKNDRELINFITNKITKGFLDINIKDPKIACSSFTTTTKNDDHLFARNYDFSKTNSMIVFTEKNKGRHASISSVDLQFLSIDVNQNLNGFMDKVTSLAATYAPLDGMNDAGVSVGIYMTYQGKDKDVPTNQNTNKPDLTSTTLLRLILDYADNLEEAIEIASSYDLHDSANTSYQYMVADASGRSAILEWIAGNDATDNDGSKRKLVVTYNDQDTHIGTIEGAMQNQVITNFIIQPGYYDQSTPNDKKGVDRYLKLYEELNKTNGIVKNEDEAMKLLKMVGRRRWKNDDDNNGNTVHSVIYNLTQKTVKWVSNENFDDPSANFEFSLKD